MKTTSKIIKDIENFGACCSIAEASKILGIGANTIRSYIARNQIDSGAYRRSGSTTLISVEWIKERLEV